MRNLLANAQAGIEAFVAQRDDLVMVVACSDNDAALLLKILRDVEQTDGSDVFLMFGDDSLRPNPMPPS